MNQETGFQKTPRNGGQTDTSGLPRPLRRFADRLDEVRSAEIFDMDQVGRVLVELAAEGSGVRWRSVTLAGITPDQPGPECHKIAIGLTGDPVPVGSRSGAIMHRNDQRRISAHTCLSSVNCK